MAFAYLQLSQNVSLLEKMIVFGIVAVTILISLKLHRNIKQNMKQLELNKIQIEINEFEFKLSKEESLKIQNILKQKIKKLKDEYEKLS